MVGGAFALAIFLFAIAAPKPAHALVATLVQVTNTSSNPVPTQAVGNTAVINADEPLRVPYFSQRQGNSNENT